MMRFERLARLAAKQGRLWIGSAEGEPLGRHFTPAWCRSPEADLVHPPLLPFAAPSCHPASGAQVFAGGSHGDRLRDAVAAKQARAERAVRLARMRGLPRSGSVGTRQDRFQLLR
jgi:hypothetical protein